MTAATAPLTLADFEAHIGASLGVAAPSGAQELVLTHASALAHSQREGGGFRLELAGPQPMLPQATYGFTVGDAAHDIFIVPIGTSPTGGFRYEAVFF